MIRMMFALALMLLALALISVVAHAQESDSLFDGYVLIQLRDSNDPDQNILGGRFKITSMEGLAPAMIVCDNIATGAVLSEPFGDVSNSLSLSDENALAGKIWADVALPQSAVQIVGVTTPGGYGRYTACEADQGSCSANGISTISGSRVVLTYVRSDGNTAGVQTDTPRDPAAPQETVDQLISRVVDLRR